MKCPAVDVQLPSDSSVAVEPAQKQVRSGDYGSDPFPVQPRQGSQGLGEIGSAIINAGDQMTVQVDNGELVVGGGDHTASLRQRSGQSKIGVRSEGRADACPGDL